MRTMIKINTVGERCVLGGVAYVHPEGNRKKEQITGGNVHAIR